MRTVEPVLLAELQALRLRATQTFVDRTGVTRPSGEEWDITQPGAYVPDVYEEVRDAMCRHTS